jgi:hypothetical protein
MKKNIFYMAALAVIAAACTNEDALVTNPANNGTSDVKMITETISATNGDDATRADVDADAKFTWSAGDQIAVHVSDGKYYTTEALAAGGDKSATFSVTYPDGQARDAFAIYPASLVAADAANYGQSGATLDVTLPCSYTLAQVSGTTTPCPMIATNAAGSGWTFKQLCGLVRLTVNGIPGSTKRLEIDFDSKKVCGTFSIATPTPGTSTIETSTDAANDIITITKDGTDVTLNDGAWLNGLVLNLPLPTGSYSNIVITAYDALTGGTPILIATDKFSYTAARKMGAKKTVSFPGVISVSSTKKVVFAPGNLQYLGNADGSGAWQFAEHQYDFMGDGPTSGSENQGNVTVSGFTKYNEYADKDVARDLFGWATSGYNDKYPYMTSSSSGSYYSGSMVDEGANYDWGVYHSASGSSTEKITNGGNYAWRLLTDSERYYIFGRQGRVYTREDSPTYSQTKDLFASATVNGVKGIILFPDNWDGSLDRKIKYGNASEAGYTKTTCDAEKWAKFEKVGCVFLPAAGVRTGVSVGSKDQGNYWESTIISTVGEYRGGTLSFGSSGAVTKSASNCSVRYLGQSVRLIREVE